MMERLLEKYDFVEEHKKKTWINGYLFMDTKAWMLQRCQFSLWFSNVYTQVLFEFYEDHNEATFFK